MSQLPPRQYFLPSAGTGLAVAVLPALTLGMLLHEMNSGSWDTNGDSGAIVGGVILAFESLILVAYAALGFPLVAFGLQRVGAYRRVTFVGVNAICLVLTSAGIALAVSLIFFGGLTAFVRHLVAMLVAALVFCLPFSILWLRWAR